MPPDDLDRDKLYTADGRRGDWNDGDDGDYELEPLDPEVLAAEQRRAAAAIDVHRTAIDVDEVYRDVDANRDSEIMQELARRLRSFRFQFQIKHLLILTAVVAVLLTLHKLGVGLVTFFAFLIMGGVAGLTLYLKLEENKRQEAADRRRRKDVRRAAGPAGPAERASRARSRRRTAAAHTARRNRKTIDSRATIPIQILASAIAAGDHRRGGAAGTDHGLRRSVPGRDALRSGRAGWASGSRARFPTAGNRRVRLVGLLVLYVVLSLFAAIWAGLGSGIIQANQLPGHVSSYLNGRTSTMLTAPRHLSTAEFERGLPDVLASPRDDGQLVAIVVRPATNERRVLAAAQLSARGRRRGRSLGSAKAIARSGRPGLADECPLLAADRRSRRCRRARRRQLDRRSRSRAKRICRRGAAWPSAKSSSSKSTASPTPAAANFSNATVPTPARS